MSMLPHLAESVVKSFKCDSQLLGRLWLVALILVEDSQNHFLFHLTQRFGFAIVVL